MRLVITARKDFPKCVRQFKELKGICVGECVDGDKWNDDICGLAHCHTNKYYSDPYDGYICLKWKHQLKLQRVLLHEMAHILVEKEHRCRLEHGRKWKEMCVRLGGTLFPYSYYGKGYAGFVSKDGGYNELDIYAKYYGGKK